MQKLLEEGDAGRPLQITSAKPVNENTWPEPSVLLRVSAALSDWHQPYPDMAWAEEILKS